MKLTKTEKYLLVLSLIFSAIQTFLFIMFIAAVKEPLLPPLELIVGVLTGNSPTFPDGVGWLLAIPIFACIFIFLLIFLPIPILPFGEETEQ